MHRPTPKLSLSDLMVLIGGVSLGLGCFIQIDNMLFRGQRYVFGLLAPLPGSWNPALVLDRVAGLIAFALVLFGGWMFALPILTVRKPRPYRRQLCRGPGWAACLASIAALGAFAAVMLSSCLIRWLGGRPIFTPGLLRQLPIIDSLFILPGVAVLAAWVTLGSSGRWRAMSDPIDRLGRLLGLFLISAALVFSIRLLLV